MDISKIDLALLCLYALVLIGIAIWSSRKNSSSREYYIGDRKIGSHHIGMSVAATDVGGGFSIGLGALGFSMGVSGSWLLFSGLLGAFLSAIFFIPKLKALEAKHNYLSFPEVFGSQFGKWAAGLAALISIVGYVGFTSSQMIAGAKLSTVIAPDFSQTQILLVLAALITFYTALGGFAAVIYTDSVQWTVILVGLSFFALPLAYISVGGYQGLVETLPAGFLNPFAISFKKFFNWMVAIVPIWFVAMTLYQRIFACPDVKQARRAWYIAGLLEWPGMAVVGALLGVFSRAALEQGIFAGFSDASQMDPELAIPLLLKNILPIGVLGIVFAAYISAVLSTADSCLMAASGNLFSDVLNRLFPKNDFLKRNFLRASQICTLVLGLIALWIASSFQSALGLMLHSYSFMISGLTVPALAAVSSRRFPQSAAIAAMLCGGGTTLFLGLAGLEKHLWGIDANVFGLMASALSFFLVSKLNGNNAKASL